MDQALLPLSECPDTVVLDAVGGDLQVIGWERNDVQARSDGRLARLEQSGREVHVTCDGDLILYMPTCSGLRVASIGGDADVRLISGALEIGNVGGDIQLRQTGPVQLGIIGGDISARNVQGDFRTSTVGGDISLRQVGGAVNAKNVGSDFYLREVGGNVETRCGADAVIYAQPAEGVAYDIKAGSDIILRIPPDANATFNLTAASSDCIRISLPGVSKTAEMSSRSQTFVIGNGSALINLVAGGEIVVTGSEDEWQSKADFDSSQWDTFAMDDIGGRISAQVDAAMQRANERAIHQAERAQARADAAVRRAEEKMRASERRSTQMGSSMGRPPGTSSRYATPTPLRPNDPVSDQERLVILKMLQDKKISLQDAEKLLAALEGK